MRTGTAVAVAACDADIGVTDMPCPECGPERRSAANRQRKVLRIWRGSDDFISWHCARCGDSGYRFGDRAARRIGGAEIAGALREMANRQVEARQLRLEKALWLWRARQSIGGTIAETYLRKVRGYAGPLQATLGFLPARREHPPAMIAAFGIPTEPEPGILAIAVAAVRGVHLTRLLLDGSGKAGDPAKIMVGHSIGFPIVLAPMNDLLGLSIAEGIEDALSVHQATGLGAWAAGCASRMPALAAAVPEFTSCVTVVADDDKDGRHHADVLAARLAERRLHVEVAQ